MSTETLKSSDVGDLIHLSDAVKHESINFTNDENSPSNNNVEALQYNSDKKSHESCKNRKRKRFISLQRQRKNKKNWKNNKYKRNQLEKTDVETLKNAHKHDKNGKRFNCAMLKFNQNNFRGRFPIISKFFLPDKRPRKDLIVPPTKFLLGGNISDPLNLNSLQNEAFLSANTPKSSPMTTPPKIEVIIPPNIHDPLHLLGPVDAIEYQKQLTSPIKRRKKAKHRNRNKKKKTDISSKDCSADSVKLEITSITADESVAKSDNILKSTDGGKLLVVAVDDLPKLSERERALKELKLEFPESILRKRKVSESYSCGKAKVRRMDSMDKIVSPVIPQPGAWKRLPRPVPSGAPRGSARNRNRAQSFSQSDDISPLEEVREGFIHTTTTATIDKTTTEVQTSDKEDAMCINETQTNENSSLPKFKNRDARYQYGNYDRYYGYRNLNEFMDVRLKVFMRNQYLFRDKDILDIGCNAGHITISVAKTLAPKSITGVDIDKNLIAKGRKNLALYVKIPRDDKNQDLKRITKEGKEQLDDNSHKNSTKNRKNYGRHKKCSSRHEIEQAKQCDEYFPISFPTCYGTIPETINSESEKLEFPNNVFFRTCNYVLKDESQFNLDTQQYDLIMCLSVTKWIHLNFGDGGLKLCFKRMFNQLRPGGKLILEAQNWASYKKKKKLTETIFNNFKTIEFYPNKFHEYLLGPEVGFSHSYALGIPRHLSKGFKRPIQLYVKGDFTPNNLRWSDNYNPQTPHDAYRGAYVEPINILPRSGNKSCWGNDTPFGNSGSYSYRFTPSQFASTSQYYNPYETDSYLPSYYSETQKRQYCFASPLYSTVWSPPSGKKSASHTVVSGSVREGDETDVPHKPKHVYPPTDGYDVGKDSNRSVDSESDKFSQHHVYSETDVAINISENSSSPSVSSPSSSKVLSDSENISQEQNLNIENSENISDKT